MGMTASCWRDDVEGVWFYQYANSFASVYISSVVRRDGRDPVALLITILEVPVICDRDTGGDCRVSKRLLTASDSSHCFVSS